MKKVFLFLLASLVLVGCSVHYSANPTDEKRKPDCVQLRRKEGGNVQNIGLYCRAPATTIAP